MVLQNSALREVQAILLPSMGVPVPVDEAPAADAAGTQPAAEDQAMEPLQDASQERVGRPSPPPAAAATSTAEFIPQIFYSLHQIRKEPNNLQNQLETSTAFIKHRLKSCKSLIANDENCRTLLSKTPQEWHEYMQNREKELQVKRKVLEDLKARISTPQKDQ